MQTNKKITWNTVTKHSHLIIELAVLFLKTADILNMSGDFAFFHSDNMREIGNLRL